MNPAAKRPTRIRFITAVLSLGASLAMATLTGCSAGTATISASDFAGQVTTIIKTQTGSDTTVDCGSEPIPLVNGGVVHCDVAGVDNPSAVYDSTTTISNVNGGDFHIDTKIADTPK